MFLLSIFVLASCLVGLYLFKRRSASASAVAPRHREQVREADPEAPGPRDETPARALQSPAADAAVADLGAFAWIRAESLPDARRQAFATVFKNVPRPPKLLQQLISPEFVNNASLEELVELISGEPLVAAKVLATVNSSMFGLKSEVTDLDQAISYLGLITLRSLCLQYMLIKSFQTDSPERQALLTDTWNASALASELISKVARSLDRPDAGRLVTLVVLSFLGRLAIAATTPRGLLDGMASGTFLQRSRQEQQILGLSSSEIGGLLMHQWDLPGRLVDDVRELDATLVNPEQTSDLALCYLCARLGEQLAQGKLRSLEDIGPLLDREIDFHSLKGRSRNPEWQSTVLALRDPGLVESVYAMTSALRSGAVGHRFTSTRVRTAETT